MGGISPAGKYRTHFASRPDAPVEFISQYDHCCAITDQSFKNRIVPMPPTIVVDNGGIGRFNQ